MTADVSHRYGRDGFVSGVEVISAQRAQQYRAQLEDLEGRVGPLHGVDKIHTTFEHVWELCTLPAVLDVVEACIGPNILLFNATYLIKEPGAPSHVSWHQDLTYWGLADDDAQVSMWLAIAPAPLESGCMQMIPGSYRSGRVEHMATDDDTNVLLMGQTITDVDEAAAVGCPLRAGEASFHHGWTVHCSRPNVTDDRRIGLNVQYLAPHNAHNGKRLSAALVRGVDTHDRFDRDPQPSGVVDDAAMSQLRVLDAQMKAGFQTQ